jgi:hypothetical protein
MSAVRVRIHAPSEFWYNNDVREAPNAIKSRQLGMPYGTACGQLRKQIMFRLLQRLGENICHQCSGVIATAEELSIEHKTPWLHHDADLFWDHENIGFSHLACNVNAAARKVPAPGTFTGTSLRRIGAEGTAWCGSHRGFAPRASFSKNRHRWNGLQDVCRGCRSRQRSRTES